MKKQLLYEIRRNLLPLVIFTAIGVVLSLLVCMVTDLEYVWQDPPRPRNSCLSLFTVILCILCVVVPAMQFSYRMKMRSADLWYSLPVSRRRLALVRTLGGLLLVLVPFTLSYWMGVAVIASRGADFDCIWYLPAFFVQFALGAGLFGVNAFIFTRANRPGDGVLFLIAWTCILPLFVMLVCPESAWDRSGGALSRGDFLSCFFTMSPLGWSATLFQDLIFRETVSFAPYGDGFFFLIALGVGVLEAAGGYTALFLRAERDRAEDADQISSSWMGYRVLVPAYVVLGLNALGEVFSNSDLPAAALICVLVLAVGLIGGFAYRRSFRLRWYDLVSLFGAFVVGTGLFFL